jgi:O-antigen ligase
MKAIRIGVPILVAFSVFAFATVEPWSQSFLEIGAVLLFVVWAARQAFGKDQGIYWNPLGWPLLAFAALGLIQYSLHLTVYPFVTKIELLKLGSYLVLFFLAGQAFRTAGQRVAWAWFLLALGFTVSLFGILQHFTFNGKLYWLRQLRFIGYPFGPFTNRDHFAGFVELIIPVGLAMLALRGTRRDQIPLVALFTIVPIGAVFLSASRGGIIATCVQLLLVATFLRKRPVGIARLMAVAAILIAAGAFVAWLGVGTALERFATLKSGVVTEQRRWIMIRDSWHVFLDHPLMGSGLGTLETAYPRHASYYDGLVVNHSHNDFIEALAETGVLGVACCAVFLVGLFRRSLAEIGSDRDQFGRAVRIGCLVACTGLLIHGLVDFNLHIPSNALLFFLQAQIASSASSLSPQITD